MRKINGTVRTVKDLIFLTSMPKQQLAPGIIKRIDVQGKGQMIKDIKVPCSVYVSFEKYDYEGKFIGHMLNICIRDIAKRNNSQIPPGVYDAVESMKIQQKAWFNFKDKQLHQVPSTPRGGCHFYISIDQIKYKNFQNLQAKKLKSEQLRKQAKQLFAKGAYQQALKRYKKQINITEAIQKKRYTAEDYEQIMKINEKARVNFLRCFSKLTNIDQATSESADKYSKQLLKKKNDDLSIFLRVHYLIQTKYLTHAEQLNEELKKRGNEEWKNLEDLIRQRKIDKK